MNRKIIYLISVLLFAHTLVVAQPSFNTIKIATSKTASRNISELTSGLKALKLSYPEHIEPRIFFETHIGTDRIFIAYTEKREATSPDKLFIFDKEGEFIKSLAIWFGFKIDPIHKKVYALKSLDFMRVFNYSGVKLDEIKLPHKINDFSLFNEKLYYVTNIKKDKEKTQYTLFAYNLGNQNQQLIKSYSHNSLDVMGRAQIDSYSRLWVNEHLFWTNGLDSHVYKIDTQNNITPIAINFPGERSFMDQAQTKYGVFEDYFYCKYSMDFKQHLYLFDGKDEIISNYKLTDDIYHTGSFYFKTSQNHKTFFIRSYEELSASHQKQFGLTKNSILLIHST